MPAGSTVGTAVALNETSMSFGPWLLKKISPGVSAKFVRCSTTLPSKSRSLAETNCTLNTDSRSRAKLIAPLVPEEEVVYRSREWRTGRCWSRWMQLLHVPKSAKVPGAAADALVAHEGDRAGRA